MVATALFGQHTLYSEIVRFVQGGSWQCGSAKQPLSVQLFARSSGVALVQMVPAMNESFLEPWVVPDIPEAVVAYGLHALSVQ
mmetsp:Transcript_35965/g.57288  ORF Transcript_35965/g.57288 Transcript_35965/m.57288 type:complete len:83 (+) Transcript_35965:1130-1378(+)